MEQATYSEAAAPQTAEAMAQWTDQRINDALQATMRPMQDQMATLLERLQALSSPVPAATPQTNSETTAPTPTAEPLPAGLIPNPRFDPSASKQRKPLPNPPKFSGRRIEYLAWQQQMKDKLLIDISFFQSMNEMWYLINSCLEPAAQQVVATYYKTAGPGHQYDPQSFMGYLDRSYGDPSARERAAANLRHLRQKEDSSLASFLPRFEKTLAEAGGDTWPDEAKITFLEGALNSQLSRSLVTVTLPNKYSDWVNEVQRIASRLEGLVKRNQRRGGQAAAAPMRTTDHEGDTSMTGIGQVTQRRGGKERAEAPQEHRESRSCFRCGKKGHLKRNCPTPPKVPRANQVRPDSEDEENSQQGSEADQDSENI